MPRLSCILALVLLVLSASVAVAQEEAPSEPALIEAPGLRQESIWLLEEEAPRSGYIVGIDEAAETMEFLEIVQRPRERVSLVSRPIALESLREEETQRLGEEDRRRLAEWIEQVRQRASIEAGRLEAVELQSPPEGEPGPLTYQGPWFELESHANDATTRRCVVRLEQMFRAYRLILPPRTDPNSSLRVLLFGSMESYNAYLARRGFELNNPAFFSIEENLIVAGGDLSLFAENLEEVQRQNEAALASLDDRQATLDAAIDALAAKLAEEGSTREEIGRELATYRRAVETALAQERQEVQRMIRLNERNFNRLSDQMFRRLYHESFHAYLENYVFPHAAGEVPPWLNEGMALIFEGGQIEGDQLRIDTPHASALAQIQRDLRTDTPLPLSTVLRAGTEDFHFRAQDDERARLYYAYAWGLTWYLTMSEDRHTGTGRPLSQEQVERSLNAADPIAAFEALVGMPLREFEPQWHDAMRRMR